MRPTFYHVIASKHQTLTPTKPSICCSLDCPSITRARHFVKCALFRSRAVAIGLVLKTAAGRGHGRSHPTVFVPPASPFIDNSGENCAPVAPSAEFPWTGGNKCARSSMEALPAWAILAISAQRLTCSPSPIRVQTSLPAARNAAVVSHTNIFAPNRAT